MALVGGWLIALVEISQANEALALLP